MAARFPHGALKLQPRDDKDITHWSEKIVSGSKNRLCPLIIVREPSMEDMFSYLVFSSRNIIRHFYAEHNRQTFNSDPLDQILYELIDRVGKT